MCNFCFKKIKSVPASYFPEGNVEEGDGELGEALNTGGSGTKDTLSKSRFSIVWTPTDVILFDVIG